jgi:hypothetical protein
VQKEALVQKKPNSRKRGNGGKKRAVKARLEVQEDASRDAAGQASVCAIAAIVGCESLRVSVHERGLLMSVAA